MKNKWIEIENEFPRFELDKSYIKNNLLSKERVRIVHYPNCEAPTYYYTKLWKSHSRNEETFKNKYPVLSLIFNLLGYNDINITSNSNNNSKENFEYQYKIKLC